VSRCNSSWPFLPNRRTSSVDGTVAKYTFVNGAKVRFVKAWGPSKWMLNAFGVAGFAAPWNRVYLLPEYYDHEVLRRHELIHIAQMQRDGRIAFLLRWLWWTAQYGYRGNPYEVEAYRGQNYTAEEILAQIRADKDFKRRPRQRGHGSRVPSLPGS
jgi:hypothetical protein